MSNKFDVKHIDYSKLILENKTTPYKIKLALEALAPNVKGKAFELFLAELFNGNGFLTTVVGNKCDGGVDLLIFNPSSPTRPKRIIQAKNHKRPLKYDDVRTELRKFEEIGTRRHDCNQFEIFSLNGFVEDAYSLRRFNVGLKQWADIKDLISSYGEIKPLTPYLNLMPHNQITQEHVSRLFMSNKRVCVIQATGTGKRYLIGANLLARKNQKCIVLSPSNHINDQQKKLLPHLTNVEYYTYAGLMSMIRGGGHVPECQFLVLDEFHRAGAPVWQKSIMEFLETLPDVDVFGTTATPVRQCGDGRDMSDELFSGVVANKLSLEDAIVRNIIPTPKFIGAFYEVESSVNLIFNEIDNSALSQASKESTQQAVLAAKVNWERSMGIPAILNKHLNSINGKYLIFCDDMSHLISMRDIVRQWFTEAAREKGDAFADPKHYVVCSKFAKTTNRETLEKFGEGVGGIHLLFSIDMLNEGIHVEGVDSVVLLRGTASLTVFLQQIGRCLTSGTTKQPVIFDLVNNSERVGVVSWKDSLDAAAAKENIMRDSFGLPRKTTEYRVLDETKDFESMLSHVMCKLSTWSVNYSHLKEYAEKFGHASPLHAYQTIEGVELGIWCDKQRRQKKAETLSKDRSRKLDAIGFVWLINESAWRQGLYNLEAYFNEYGHATPPRIYKTKDKFNLGVWCGVQRLDKKKGDISEQRIKLLDGLGFVWDVLDKTWNDGLSRLRVYVDEFGHASPAGTYKTDVGVSLGLWCERQRSKKRRGTLDEEKCIQLEELNFVWAAHEQAWMKGFNILKAYKELHGNIDLLNSYKTKSGFLLGRWCDTQRADKRKSNLSKQRIKLLESIGFVWEPQEKAWEFGLNNLKTYLDKHGNIDLTTTYKSDNGFLLGRWCDNQRTDKRKGVLSDHRFRLLDKMGLTWEPKEKAWYNSLISLKKYYRDHGHVNVPKLYCSSDKIRLDLWCRNQRVAKKSERLNQDRIKELDDLGFSWLPLESNNLNGGS